MADQAQQDDRPRVLVVDDDAYLRLLLSMEVPEIDLIEASSMREAFELALQEKPDAILVDRKLPDGDGLELVRKLRTHISLRQSPIMLITAGHDEIDRAEVMKAGADEYLPKPVDAPDLLARLERILTVAPEVRKARRAALIDRIHEEPGTDPDPPSQADDTAAGDGSSTKRRRLGRMFRRG